MENICLFGNSDLARTVYLYMQNDSNYNILGFTVNERYIIEDFFCGEKVYPFERIDEYFSNKEDVKILVCVGYNNLQYKESLSKQITDKGYGLTNFLHKTCSIEKNVNLGINNIFFQNVIVEPSTSIGDGNVFWSGSIICHDTQIDNYNFFSANTTIGGFVKIRNYNFFGFSSCVKERIELGSNMKFGAKSFIRENFCDNGLYYGVPAKKQE